MKHKVYILLFVCLNCLTGKAQNLFVADYSLYGSTDKSLICNDRSFFKTFVVTTGKLNAIKTDSAGNVIWSNQIEYPPCTFFTFTGIEQAADSGYLILFNIKLVGMNHSDPSVTKLDKAGNYLWTKRYVSVLSAYGNGIIRNNDNGFIVVGSRQLSDMVMKCDNMGAISWVNEYNSGTANAADYAISTHDYSHFVITGRHQNYLRFFQLDLSGNLLWHSDIAFANTGIGARSLKPLRNGGYAVTGQVNYIPANNNDSFLAKTDSVGNVLWLRVYSAGNESHGNDLTELPDSSLLMVGLGQGLNVDGYALKTDKDGNFQFTKNEVAAAFNEFTSVHLFSAGAVMLSGQIINPFISLTDTACSSFCNIAPYTVLESVPAYADTQVTVTTVNLPFSEDTLQVIYTAHPLTRHVLCGFTSAKENIFQNEIEVYPNPIADKLNITINNGLAEIILCDVASRKLLQQKFTNSVSLNTAQLARGIYLYEVRGTNGLIKKGKVVKE